MRMPVGNPLLDTSHHLFAKFCVLERPRRLGRKAKDRLPVRGSLFKPHALGYDRLEHLRPENIAYLLVNFPCERRALIKQRYDDAKNSKIWVRAGLYFLNGLKQIVRPF